MHWALQLTFAATALGCVYALGCAWWVLGQWEGDERLQRPYQAIRQGAAAFMRIQYGTIAMVGLIIFLLLWWIPRFGPVTALGFALGGLCSGLSGTLGMAVSVRANVRTAAAAQTSLSRALQIAYRSGSVTGFLLASLALASVAGFYLWLESMGGNLAPLAGLGFGASLVSIFARLGGGIFTKAADVGADLAGKVEQNIPEDDPRNPAVIADNVGDNVGDCAGMAADVFESYAVTLVAAILVATWHTPESLLLKLYPLALGGTALLASLLGGQFLWLGRSSLVGTALLRTIVLTLVLSAAGYWWITRSLHLEPALFQATLVGLAVGLGLVLDTAYFTGMRFPPVQRIAEASCQGHATNIITGLAMGMKSAAAPALLIAIGVIAAHQLAGIYGIAVATTALLALTPIIISMDAYGPVADNAGGIVEMASLPETVRRGTDALDAAGNMTKALTKTFAIGSAGLAALALFAAYRLEFGVQGHRLVFSLDDPFVLGGIFCGTLLPFLFSGLALEAVGKSAGRVVEEVRRQFRQRPEILKGTALPDYAHTVAMLTRSAIAGMLVPGALPVAAPVLAALLTPWMPPGGMALLVGGMLMGAVATGLLLALNMGIGGGAWDNAKKYIEAGHYGGKGSPAHHAAVTGDTVGDPYKDTAGPAINPMTKVLSLMAVLLAPFLS
ncbi:MAG TPA: sodium-translocating pyrophosphatase [Methylothermaceae bacterium]|nr:sodium-translocating pyrophosphatase [Methylothermaceae bacterium]